MRTSPLIALLLCSLLVANGRSAKEGSWNLSRREKVQVFWGVADGAKDATLQFNIGGSKPNEMPIVPSIDVKVLRFDGAEIAQVEEPVIASTYSWEYWTRMCIFVFPMSAMEEAKSIVFRFGKTSYIKRRDSITGAWLKDARRVHPPSNSFWDTPEVSPRPSPRS